MTLMENNMGCSASPVLTATAFVNGQRQTVILYKVDNPQLLVTKYVLLLCRWANPCAKFGVNQSTGVSVELTDKYTGSALRPKGQTHDKSIPFDFCNKFVKFQLISTKSGINIAYEICKQGLMQNNQHNCHLCNYYTLQSRAILHFQYTLGLC